MKYSRYFGEQIRKKKLPDFSKNAFKKLFNVVHLEAMIRGMDKTHHLLDKDNNPNFQFLKKELQDELKHITRDLPPQLFYHSLCNDD